jgi:hypothetical protein
MFEDMPDKQAHLRERLANIPHFMLSRRRPLPPAWRDGLVIFFASRLFYTLIGLFVWWTKYRPAYADEYYYHIPPLLNGVEGALLGVWQRWDGIIYQRIATYGYADNQLSLFYPLYPLLGRWLADITHWNVVLTLLLVSNIAFLLSLVLLYQIVSMHFSAQIARITLVCTVLFPTTFYFFAIYPQSLLLFLILLTYYLVRRGWWAGAVVTGFLAGLTHSTAVALPILVGIEALQLLWPKVLALREKRWLFEWKTVFVFLAPFASLVGIASFLAWRTWAGFPSYIQLETGSYSRAMTMPWDGLVNVIRFILFTPRQLNLIVAWMNSACFLLVVFFVFWSFRRIPWSWWFMQTGFLVFILTNLTGGYPVLGFSRYFLSIFPLFVEIPLLGQKPLWRMLKFGLGLLLAFSFSAMFFMWLYDLS